MPIALVLGCALGVYEEAKQALELFEPDAIAAVNDIGMTWQGRLDYWITLHAEKADCWPGIKEATNRRLKAGLNRPEIWTHNRHPASDKVSKDWGGSSGLFATKIMLEERFSKIVLAGIPMTTKAAHYYSDKIWNAANTHRNAWTRHKPELEKHVRSMSGWTMEQFGFPAPEFLIS